MTLAYLHQLKSTPIADIRIIQILKNNSKELY